LIKITIRGLLLGRRALRDRKYSKWPGKHAWTAPGPGSLDIWRCLILFSGEAKMDGPLPMRESTADRYQVPYFTRA